MNIPPIACIYIDPSSLKQFVASTFSICGMAADRASLLADLLVTNDMRGVYSHGSVQCSNYSHHFRHAQLDPNSTITTVRESPTTLVLDGGGGLGYFPCLEAIERVIEKARACGIAVAITSNHGHFGAAGIYARVPLPHGMISYVTSGHQLDLSPDRFVMAAAGGSPMAFGIPCGQEPDFVLDFGAVHDMYLGPEEMRPIVEMVPSTVLRSFGLGCACQALGGLLCGVPVDPARANRAWPGANQGSLMIVIDIEAIGSLEAFRTEMDEYSQRVRKLTPLPGIDASLLPGEIEERRYSDALRKGVTLGERQTDVLRALAKELGLKSPF